MRVAESVLELIGFTPMVRLRRLGSGLRPSIYAKLEFYNPTGSLKDRIAMHMIREAERKAILKPDSIIVEATTGNTGISFSMVGAMKGYKTIVVMPEGMSEERKKIIRAFGAEIVFTPGGESDVDKCLKKVEEMVRENPKIWVPGQFSNEDNVAAHRATTGPEILEQLNGKVDAFVAGVGTGGTLTGVAQALRTANAKAKIIAVEPAECAILSGGSWGRHRIEGIGDGFIPPILDRQLIDEVIPVRDEEAIKMARRLAREEGILCGISSGANLCASLEVATRLKEGENLVTLIPDSGQRYFTTDLFG